ASSPPTNLCARRRGSITRVPEVRPDGGSVSPNSGLAGTVAWITGAARGMGASHSRRLAELGAAVGCLDVNAAELEQVVASIRSAGGTAEAVVADVSDWDAMASA